MASRSLGFISWAPANLSMQEVPVLFPDRVPRPPMRPNPKVYEGQREERAGPLSAHSFYCFPEKQVN